MSETFLDGRVTLWCGNVLTTLATLPSDHFDCVVTSPPYWGLRDYGTARWEGGDPTCDHRSPTMRDGRNDDRAKIKGSAATNSAQNILAHHSGCGRCGAIKIDEQIGLERSLGEHLAVMVDVFREVRRVLKPSGTLWLNYGDCYATSPNGRSAADTKAAGVDDRTFRDKPFSTIGPVLKFSEANASRNKNSKAKESYREDAGNRIHAGGYLKAGDLCMIPNRLAIALQDDGWWVKAENIWGKPNGMPDSSGVYRPSTSHEKIWLLAKSDECEYWRARDTGEMSKCPDLTQRVPMITTGELGPRWIRMPFYYNAAAVRLTRATPSDGKKPDGWNTAAGGHGSFHPNGREKGEKVDKQRGHTRRHAGFNDRWDKMERAEQIAGGRLLRNYEPAPVDVWSMATSSFSEAHFATFPIELAERCITAGCPPDGEVLDPFGGSGTTAIAAVSLGRRTTLIELNPEYCRLARTRIEAAFMGKEEGARHMTKQLGKTVEPGPLFAGLTEGANA